MKFRWIRELFSFSGKERTGILTLLFIIFFLIVLWKLIPILIPKETVDFSEWEAQVNTYLANSKTYSSVDESLHPVVFNPNKADSATLVAVGLPPQLIANWLKYLRKGGRFRDREGVKKIYGMTSNLYRQLDSFLVFPPAKEDLKNLSVARSFVKGGEKQNSVQVKPQEDFVRKKRPAERLELNKADSVMLVEVPGIGPVLASRIIKYRNLLGGYYDVSQLREVYGLREENFAAVAPHFTVDPSALKSFNINFATVQQLGRHPYVGFRTARRIFSLRDKMGKFSAPEDLATVVGGDSLKRLIPYVKFNQ